MDWAELATWKIMDTVGKWLTVDGSLFMAYCKAKTLDRRVAGMWEVTPSEYEIVNERGMIINMIRKVCELRATGPESDHLRRKAR
jgi:uncharacterized cupin superfamily protein